MINIYNYFFFKIYRWVKKYLPHYLGFNELPTIFYISMFELVQFLTIYNFLFNHFKIPEHIFNHPTGVSIIAVIICVLNLIYFKKRYEVIYATYHEEKGIKKWLGTILVLFYMGVSFWFFTISYEIVKELNFKNNI